MSVVCSVIGDKEAAELTNEMTAFEQQKGAPGKKRKREGRGDPGTVDEYQGPWADFVGEVKTAKPTEVGSLPSILFSCVSLPF